MRDILQNYTNINSILYSELFSLGGDSLISVYAHLKFGKNGAIKYYKQEKTSIYKTLKQATNLSITTLKKYIPILQKEGLVYFDTVGNFCILGNNKINILYKKKGRTKLVPIEIAKTFKETKLFSFRVRIKSMEQTQKNAIDLKSHRNNLIAKAQKRQFLTKLEFKQLKNITKRKLSVDNLNDKVILSIQGYYKLKSGKRNNSNNGQYWKAKLQTAGIIKTRRVQELIKKSTEEEFKALNSYDKSLFYYKGAVYQESISEFTTTEFHNPAPKVINRETKSKPLQHLSFDVIDWWLKG